MQYIEKIKEQLAMKYVAGNLRFEDIKVLPKNDEVRIFMCSLSSLEAYWYAKYIDKSPTEETRIAACKNSTWAFHYAREVDKEPTKETRSAACKDFNWAYCYARDIDKKPTEETRIAACEDSTWKSEYEKFEREYNERHRKN
jgi:hypothetical protein